MSGSSSKTNSNGSSGKQGGRTWISAEISPELLEALECRAKARGISRSEGLRQALRDWTGAEDQEAKTAEPTPEERGQRIVARLDELREEIILGIAGGDRGRSAGPQGVETATARDAVPAPSKPASGNAGGLEQMELYEGEDLLACLDQETEKARRREEEGASDREQ